MIPTPGAASRLSLESCYRDLGGDAAARSAADALLGRRHWLHAAAEFDQRTGEMLALPLTGVCESLRGAPPRTHDAAFKDRLYRIAEHIREPMGDILRGMHQRLVREHASLPIRSVRELDSASFFALTRRSGRTIREKLADRPYLLAVERRWTTDSSENRLVKALCGRLAHLLRVMRDQQSPAEASWLDDFSSLIEGWLHSPAADEIGRWENLAPNNILLQHRDYRRLWDAWLWSQTLDEDMQRDQDHSLAQWTTIVFWTIVSRLAATDGVRLLEQPCHPAYEPFAIVPARSGSDGRILIEGVLGTATSGRRIGIVSRTAGDRRGPRFGTINLPNGELVSFDREAFPSQGEADRVAVGTQLVFDVVVAADGGRWALKPERLLPPGGLRVTLSVGVAITIAPPHGKPIEIRFSKVGPYGRAEVGLKRHVMEMSAVTGANVADDALSAALGSSLGLRKRDVEAEPARRVPVCAIDLCRVRPRFSTGDPSRILPFRLLWQLWSASGRESVALDLGVAPALSLENGVTTISILDLIAAETALSADSLSRAARSFAAALADAVPTEALTYIVPDATDEFALGTLRRSINSKFRDAEPLPRSIAAVFSWQSSARHLRGAVRDGDCVIVLDTVGETVSATPLFARERVGLAARVPESGGICWERTPTVLLGEGENTSTALALARLDRAGCAHPATPARLFGVEGLTEAGCEISWLGDDDEWFTPPPESVGRNAFDALPDLWAPLARALDHELRDLRAGARLYVIPASEVARAFRLDAPAMQYGHDVIFVGDVPDPPVGGVVLHRWQARAGDIPLWCDHLPELSMRIIGNGRHSRFYLVKDTTVAPRRGQAIPIEIKETFVLPAGLRDYRFPLLQGVGGNALRYEAHLRSSAFPLLEDLKVSLRLTYTYGSDTPYDLVFKPVVETPSLDFVRAEWRLREDADELPAHFPTMPPPHSWSYFEHYPRRLGRGTRSLFAGFRDQLALLSLRLAELSCDRPTVVVATAWLGQVDRRFLYAAHSGSRVFCSESEFVFRSEAAGVAEGDVLSVELKQGERGLKAVMIAASANAEREVRGRNTLRTCNIMASGLGPIFVTLWSQGRSVVQPDVPPEFRSSTEAVIETLRGLLGQLPGDRQTPRFREVVQRQSDEALLLLCSLHMDAPAEVAQRLEGILDPKAVAQGSLERFHRHIALAIGNCRLDWQRKLLGRVVSVLVDQSAGFVECSHCLQILGIAIWRCAEMVDTLPNAAIAAIVDRAILVLRETHTLIENSRPGWSPAALKDHLELVLGLLTVRGAEDAERKGILAPAKPTTRALANAIDEILDSVAKFKVPILSRLSLDIAIPAELSQTPKLLYALKLYLTGDDGAQAIRVLDVREDDNDDA